MTYNRITLRGYVGRDPELWYVSPTAPIARFPLATDGDGRLSEDGKSYRPGRVTEWHTIYCQYRLAETADASVFKGLLVEVEGRLAYTTIYRPGREPRKVAYIVADRLKTLTEDRLEDLTPEEERPNNPYGDYIDYLGKAAGEDDYPF